MARTSREGDRVEQAVPAASSVTLRNGACHIRIPTAQPTRTQRTSVQQPESDQTVRAAERSHHDQPRGGPNSDNPSLTGRSGRGACNREIEWSRRAGLTTRGRGTTCGAKRSRRCTTHSAVMLGGRARPAVELLGAGRRRPALESRSAPVGGDAVECRGGWCTASSCQHHGAGSRRSRGCWSARHGGE